MSKYALKLALPLAILGACGGDDGDNTGGADTSTTNPGTETGPGTTDNTTGPEPTTAGTDTTEPTTAADTTAGVDSTGTGGDVARVRVMHLGVGAPAVDVFANGEGPVFEGLEFRNSTEYAEVPAGDYTFDVAVSGDPATDAVLSPMLTLDPSTSYTAVAIGDLAMTDGAPGLQAIALVDDAEGIDAANVRITVIHAAPAIGQVDIWEISGEPVALLENVDFAASATLPDIPAGPLEIGVDVDDDATPDVTFSVDTTAIAGSQVNVYANNDAEGGVALVAQLPDGTILTIDPN